MRGNLPVLVVVALLAGPSFAAPVSQQGNLSTFFIFGAHDMKKGIHGLAEDDPFPFYGSVASGWSPDATPLNWLIFEMYRLSPESTAAGVAAGFFPPGVGIYAFVKGRKGLPVEYWTLGKDGSLGLLWECGNGDGWDARTWLRLGTDGSYDAPGILFAPRGMRSLQYFLNALHEYHFRCRSGQLRPAEPSMIPIVNLYSLSRVYDLGTERSWLSAVDDLRRIGAAPPDTTTVSDESVVPHKWITELRAIAGRPRGRASLLLRHDQWGGTRCAVEGRPSTCTADEDEYSWGMCLDWGTRFPFCMIMRWDWREGNVFRSVATVTTLVTGTPIFPARPICQQ